MIDRWTDSLPAGGVVDSVVELDAYAGGLEALYDGGNEFGDLLKLDLEGSGSHICNKITCGGGGRRGER